MPLHSLKEVSEMHETNDFLSNFLDYTSAISSPEIFRLWSALSALAGAVERRVGTRGSAGTIFPNLYVLLVGGPASGKTLAINEATIILRSLKGIKLAPKGITKARLLDVLEASLKIVPQHNSTPISYSSLFVSAPELGTFLPAYDLNFLNVLNDIFDNPELNYQDETRHGPKVDIAKPQLNLLMGTQPGYLSSFLPEEAWSTGFMTRVVMIYSASISRKNILSLTERDAKLRSSLVSHLTKLSKLSGTFAWEPKTFETFAQWQLNGCPPEPKHPRLTFYNGRRPISIVKLCMLSSLARGTDLTVRMEDFKRAISWLVQAEHVMPDVFRDMVHKSDGTVLQDLHQHVWSIYAKTQKPIHASILRGYLAHRVPSEKVERILTLAQGAKVLKYDITCDGFTPRPPGEHGMEGLER